MSRLPLEELQRLVLAHLDDEWETPTELVRPLGLGNGIDYFKVALVLERLVLDGHAEIRHPAGAVRRFRRR